MLFQKKPAPPEPQSIPCPEWPDPSGPIQTLYVGVHDWYYRVHPSVRAQGWGLGDFEFEGATAIGAMKDIGVVADIQVLELDEEIETRPWSDYWQTVPKIIEGYGCLLSSHNNSLPDVALTLYCKTSALEWLYRAFLCGLSSPDGGLRIDVQITYPDPMTPQFWKGDWRSKSWQVVSWVVHAGVHRQK